ncbi:MAG TPA: hypothetical protein VFH06_05535 [Candidatus Saccharimonadales bacterium]|nr:hypothetical protein [Candidatus Saccharimonadales bacterium]
MLTVTNTAIQTPTFFAQAYGTGTYSCGAYQQGCTSGTTTAPTAPNTGMLLSEPSFVIPGSLLLAVIIAIFTTLITKKLRRKTH